MEIVFAALFFAIFFVLVAKISKWLRIDTLKSPAREIASFAAFGLAVMTIAASVFLIMQLLLFWVQFG